MSGVSKLFSMWTKFEYVKIPVGRHSFRHF